ncbi:MAG: M14 family metallopeptidase [Ilumatobacteraceae bacterium]
MKRRHALLSTSIATLSLVACSGEEATPLINTTTPVIAEVTTTTSATTSTSTTTTLPPTETVSPIGETVQGASIDVIHRVDTAGSQLASTDPSRVVVLVVGVIHGNEQAGLDVIEELRNMAPRDIPANVDLFLMPALNVDGLNMNQRQNANGVDLNRNFPYNWGPISQLGNWEYSGPSSASEPETKAMTAFVDELRPDLTVWFHQDEFSIAPSSGPDKAVREEYARLTGLPLEGVPGGTYTGVAATWQRRTYVDDTAFIVELGSTLAPGEALTHARAILSVSQILP